MSARLPIRQGFVSFRGQRTWYRVVGDGQSAGKLPLMLLNGGPGVPHDAFQPLAEWAHGRRLPGIVAPTLMLGDRYDECTPAIEEDLHRRLPGSERVVCEHGAHLPHLEGPERFREVVEALLARVERDGGGGAA